MDSNNKPLSAPTGRNPRMGKIFQQQQELAGIRNEIAQQPFDHNNATSGVENTLIYQPNLLASNGHIAEQGFSTFLNRPANPNSTDFSMVTIEQDHAYEFDENGFPRQMWFENDNACALAYRHRIKMRPHVQPHKDVSIYQVQQHQEFWIPHLVHAMYDVSDTFDKPDGHEVQLFTRNTLGSVLGPTVEATARTIFEAVILRCTEGFRGPLKDSVKARKGTEDQFGTCQTRLQNIIEALRASKCACRDALYDNYKIMLLVNHPLTFLEDKKRNLKNNDFKKRSQQRKNTVLELFHAELANNDLPPPTIGVPAIPQHAQSIGSAPQHTASEVGGVIGDFIEPTQDDERAFNDSSNRYGGDTGAVEHILNNLWETGARHDDIHATQHAGFDEYAPVDLPYTTHDSRTAQLDPQHLPRHNANPTYTTDHQQPRAGAGPYNELAQTETAMLGAHPSGNSWNIDSSTTNAIAGSKRPCTPAPRQAKSRRIETKTPANAHFTNPAWPLSHVSDSE